MPTLATRTRVGCAWWDRGSEVGSRRLAWSGWEGSELAATALPHVGMLSTSNRHRTEYKGAYEVHDKGPLEISHSPREELKSNACAMRDGTGFYATLSPLATLLYDKRLRKYALGGKCDMSYMD